MSQHHLEFHLHFSGSKFMIFVAVVDGVGILEPYRENLKAGAWQHCAAAIKALADDRKEVIGRWYQRVSGPIHAMRFPARRDALLLCPHEPSAVIAVVHACRLGPQDSVGPRNLAIADERAKSFLEKIP